MTVWRLEVQDHGVGKVVSSKTSLGGLQVAIFSVSSHGLLCVCVLISSSSEEAGQIGLEPPYRLYLTLIISLWALSPNIV